MPVLTAEGVSKRYGSTVALDDVSFTVEPGEVLALLGRNGAGKTTMLSIAAGLRRPDAGTVLVGDVDVGRDPRGAIGRVGLAAQDVGVYPVLTVHENLRYVGRLTGDRGTSLERRVTEVAESLSLGPLAERRARVLSGGEKRRLHVGMAMMGTPPVLLLDEPSAGVDVQTRPILLDVVRQVAAKGAAVVYSTHYIPEVEALEATVIILDDGRLAARGSIAELVRGHGDPAVEVLFRSTPPPLAHEGRVEVDGRLVRLFTDGDADGAGRVMASVLATGAPVESMAFVRPSLERAFLAVTGTGPDVAPSEVAV